MPQTEPVVNNGFQYKRGRHGLVFRWNGEEWIRTARTWAEVSSGKEIRGHHLTPAPPRSDYDYDD